MKKLTILAFVVIGASFLGGCATAKDGWDGFTKAYADQPWTPDSFDYTNYRDKNGHQDQHGFGFSWSLKK